MNVHIFIRKRPYTEDKKTSPFIYLGLADYHESSGDKPMNIVWKLKNRPCKRTFRASIQRSPQP